MSINERVNEALGLWVKIIGRQGMMTVRDLIAKLLKAPEDCRVLVDVGGIVGDVEDCDVVSPLEDYVCSGFDDNLEDVGDLLNKKVVILQ
jgi:hypothetical protein